MEFFGYLFVIYIILGIIFKHYPNVRLAISDLILVCCKSCKFLFGWLRKKAVEFKYTGLIDSYLTNFNDNSMVGILSKCKIKWISPNKNEDLLFEGNDVIICMHLDKNLNENIYNALQYYISKSLLPNSDPFMDEKTISSIRIMSLRLMVLTNSKLLPFFNKMFSNQTLEIKNDVRKLEVVNSCGFFNKILVPSLHFWTLKIMTQLPDEYHKTESNEIIEWVYYNANAKTKEHEEDSDFEFTFNRKNIKIALIVIANHDYFEDRGYLPYIRRAHSYSSQNYDSVFIIALGTQQGDRALNLVNILIKDNCFTKTSKYNSTIIYHPQFGKNLLFTCISLVPNYYNTIQAAWKNLKKSYNASEKIEAFICDIHQDGITVNYEGLLIEIYKSNLSEEKDINHYLYFEKYSSIDLKIVNLDLVNYTVELSNKGTKTDPINIINLFKSQVNSEVVGCFSHVIVIEGKEKGVEINFFNQDIIGFIPKELATNAKYATLTSLFNEGDEVNVYITSYNIKWKKYICKLHPIYDPFSSTNFEIGKCYDLYAVCSSYAGLECKLENGIPCFIPASAFSWFDKLKNIELIEKIENGYKLSAKLIKINTDKKSLIFSRKDAIPNDIQEFVNNNLNSNFPGVIERIENSGIYIRLSNDMLVYVKRNKNNYFIFTDQEKYLQKDIDVTIVKYDDLYESITGELA